ncbi:MAG: hypothetical protein ACUVWK_01940 [Nitrososphaerales archaeon]
MLLTKNVVVIIGEVGTASTVNEGKGTQWQEYSFICDAFYLYVPKDYALEANRILNSKRIPYAGLRTYAYDSQGNIVIRNV